MWYILIPAGIFVIAITGIWLMISRKFVYLRRLFPDAISDPEPTIRTFWSGFFPEVVTWFGKINWREYRVRFMTEFEKMLRRMRLIFLKTESVIHKFSLRLRRSTKRHEELLVREEEAKTEEIISELKHTTSVTSPIDPKEEEQHLIMEIAKDPKDPLLYQRLGDIYLKTGELENARQSFETVLQLDPENWYAKEKVKILSKPE